MNGRLFSFFFDPSEDDSTMAETESFRIKYDGEAFIDHTIDINDLAPSLLALGDLIHETNRIANGDTSKISIKVKATETGCFQIAILATQDVYHNAVKVLAGDQVTAISNLTSLLWWGTATFGGVVLLIKRFGKNPPKNAIPKGENYIEIETESGTITITKLEWELYQSPIVRKAFYTMIKPLEKPGIETVEFIGPEHKKATVIKDEVKYFLPPGPTQEHLQDLPPRETYVNVVHMWFKDGNKWKFSEGGSEWSAEVKDQKFVDEVNKGERAIHANDFLKVKVKQTQRRVGLTVYSDFEVVEVLEHKKGYEQIPLS